MGKHGRKFLLVTLTGAALFGSRAQAATFGELRDEFEAGTVPASYELDDTKWHCESAMLDREIEASDRRLFHFSVSSDDHRVLSNANQGGPDWAPKWFAEFQGLRSTLPVYVNDFTKSPSCKAKDLWDCVRKGTELPTYAYLRMSLDRELLVEWTTPKRSTLTTPAISPDSELPGQVAFLYSRCKLREDRFSEWDGLRHKEITTRDHQIRSIR